MVTGRVTNRRSWSAFKRDRRGNVAMMWALMGTVLIGLIGLTVDFTRAQMIRSQLQNAADGAVLAAAGAPGNVSLADLTALATSYFQAEAGSLATGSTLSLSPVGTNGYRVDVSAPMEIGLARLINNTPWNVAVRSEAERGGVNLEVALVLDTTGSMSGQRITDLRNSAGDLVDIVVSDVQTPFYSKVALVTWGMGVNAGTYADNVRGTIPAGRNISGAAWANGAAKNITGITRARPGVVTSNNHGFSNNDVVWITGVNGMTQVNGRAYTVRNVTTNTFELYSTAATPTMWDTRSSAGYSAYTSGGTVQRCLAANCNVVVTSNGHGFANNDYVWITGVNGMTQINSATDTPWQITGVTANTYTLLNTTGPTYSAYTSSGTGYCTTLGCQYYRFTNASGSQRVLQISNCVSERVTTNVTTDAAPSTTFVGRNYASTGNPCDTGTGLIPLTTDRAALRARISALTAGGSTAGQVGTAWGWYMLSPNWGYLWPNASQRPAAYGAPNTQKIAVLMTDGAFNTAYCNGVIAQNSLSGSGSNNDHINCNATNGASAAQTIALCTAMKARGIIVYTVGFHIDNDATAMSVFSQCATSADHFFLADDGTSLQEAFRQIGQSISQLRLTR